MKKPDSKIAKKKKAFKSPLSISKGKRALAAKMKNPSKAMKKGKY